MAAHSRGIFQSTFPLQGTTVIDTVQYTGLKFQSTFPLQGTTVVTVTKNNQISISIHVPIAGNDRGPTKGLSENMKFQSTFPLQGTTLRIRKLLKAIGISIHVPIAGNDLQSISQNPYTLYFNPRSHCRERQGWEFKSMYQYPYFNPRSHCRERPLHPHPVEVS